MIYKIVSKLQSLRISFQLKKKYAYIISTNPELNKYIPPKSLKINFKKLWSRIGKSNIKYLKLYIGVNHHEDPSYVPENIYYNVIEPRLNNMVYTIAYADKNIYEIIHKENAELFPQNFLRKMNNTFYDSNYNFLSTGNAQSLFEGIDQECIIIKPSTETAGGKSVKILTKKDNKWLHKNSPISFDDINKQYIHNFILQQKIDQHSFFKKFNESSVNTIRVFTYRSVKTNIVHVLHCVLRVGKKGMEVDNQAAGGYSIGINENGNLNDFAIDKTGKKFTEINNIVLSVTDKVPLINPIKENAKKLASKFFYNRLLAFDFCVVEDNTPCLLEVNLKNIEINFLQMNNGPLFKEFTNEIIEYCTIAPKSINLDFYV